jgi:Protein of unknown function (DUF2975)
VERPSVLRVAWVTLRTLIALTWVYGALILCLLLVSFQAEQWTWRALGVGAIAGHEGIVLGMRSIMVIGIVSVPIAFVFFRELLRIVISVRAGEPFTLENAGRLKVSAWALLALQVLHVGVAAIASAVSTKEVPLHISGNFNVTGWLAILLLFVLAQVFLEGARMHDDLEGTV